VGEQKALRKAFGGVGRDVNAIGVLPRRAHQTAISRTCRARSRQAASRNAWSVPVET
jgi:hypothetical protein